MVLSQRLGAATIEYATRAEDLGFHGVFVFDHLVPLGDPFAPALEATAALGSMAPVVGTRLGTLVLRATLRPPEVTAAIATTLKGITRRPPVIGLGAGDSLSRPETARFGLSFPPPAERLRLLDATRQAVQRTGVETWIGGTHPGLVEIAGRADGWNLWEPDPERVDGLLADRSTRSGYTLSWGGRARVGPPSEELWMTGPNRLLRDRVSRLGDLGFDELVLAPLPATDPRALDLLAEAVLHS